MPKGYINPGLEKARVKTYFQSGNTVAKGVRLKAGAHRDVNSDLLPRDVRVTADQTTEALAEHADVLFAFNEMILAKLREKEHVALSKLVGDYIRYGMSSAKLAEQLRCGSLRPGEFGELRKEQVVNLKQRYARMVENGRAQLLLVRQYADAMGKGENGEAVLLHDVLDDGKPPYWLEDLHSLLTSTTSAIREWGTLLVWEERRGKRVSSVRRDYFEVIGVDHKG